MGSSYAAAPSTELSGPVAAFFRSTRYRSTFWRIGVILAVLTLWELLSGVGVLQEQFFSKPTTIVHVAVTEITSPGVVAELRNTIMAAAGAFAVGTLCALVVGLVIGFRPLLRQAYYPIIVLLLGTPKSAFLPIFVMFFGVGAELAIAYGAVLTFVHVAVNVVAGVDMIERRHLQVAAAFQANALQRFFHVILPAATPGLFAALWHGLRNGFVGVLVAELFLASAGVGYLVRTYSNNFQAAEAMAVVFIVSIFLILVGTAWNRLEAYLTRWRS